jgi:hypothetical protein
LRNRAPLAVEKPYGKGRVVLFTTTYAPYWNDVALGPGVILALRLQSHLGAARRTTVDQRVGTEIDVRLDRERYRQDIRFFSPSDDPTAPLATERAAEKQGDDSRFMKAAVAPDETVRSGIYEMWFNRVDGTIDTDRFAVNVDAREGDLEQTSTRDIIANLDPVPIEIGYADEYETAAIEEAGFNQSLLLMCLLILLLVGEQLLAYFASYHPSRRSGAGGGAARRQRLQRTQEDDADDLAAVASAWTTPDESNSANSPMTTTARGAQS